MNVDWVRQTGHNSHMRLFCILTVLILLGVTAKAENPASTDNTAASPATKDVLQFFNGDMLRGVLRSIAPPAGVRWEHPDSRPLLEFQLANVAMITLGTPVTADSKGRNTCRVRLTNQNELLGDLVTLDADTVVLDTWYAGKITLQRKMVQSLNTTSGSQALTYEGPTGLEGWTIGRGQGGWKYQNGTFTAVQPTSIGRDIKLPALANIEFDLNWRGYLQFMIGIYADHFEGYGGNCYMLQLNNNYVSLQSIRANSGGNNLGQTEIPNLYQKSKVRIGLRVNKEEKIIALLVDGSLVKQWRDPGQFAGQGTGIFFFHQGQGLVRVGNIKATTWDGKIEDLPRATGKSKEDVVTMANNDKVSGALEGIRDGKITFATSYAKLEIPMQRVSQIEMSGEKTSEVTKNPNDIQVFFADRGNVTFVLESWNEQQVIGASPSFGKLKFATAALRQIQFNLSRQKTEPEDLGPAGDAPEGFEINSE